MAHVGTSRVDDEVGEVLEPANRLRSHRRPEVEDEAGDDVAGLPWSHASVCSSTASWWSSSPCWLGGWWPMAMATATACSRGSQGREGKREPEEGGAVQREWGERGEALGVSVASRGCRGGCHGEAGGGGLRVCACDFSSAY